MTLSPSNQRDWPWALLLPGLTVFFHALSADALYKLCLFSTPIWLGVLAYRTEPKVWRITSTQLAWIALYPTYLLLGQLFHGNEIAIKATTHFFLFSAITAGIVLWAAARKHHFPKESSVLLPLVFTISYTTIELIAVYYHQKPYGTLKNPHLLAQYCMLLLIACLYQYKSSQHIIIKLITIAAAIPLCILLVKHTASRPAWLALIASLIIFFSLQNKLYTWKTPLFLVCALLGVYYLDLGDFRLKVDAFIDDIPTEARWAIWRDTINMQQDSSLPEWIFGHGVERFYSDFERYSEWHNKGYDFNAPHNHALEVLYATGICGTLAAVGIIYTIYSKLIRLHRVGYQQLLIATIISIFTANLLFTSVTISFFRSYSLLILALVGGLTIALHNHHESNHADYPQL